MAIPFMKEKEFFMKKYQKTEIKEINLLLEFPERHLLLKTPMGLVCLSDHTTIEDFVRRIISKEKILDVKIEKTGGVLNDVYHILVQKEKGKEKIVVKRFKDWHGVKWFPLTFWTLGTKSFAVLGQSRIEREYAINQFLKKKGFLVPTIYYVSPQNGLIFEEFINGENFVSVVKRVISSKRKRTTDIGLIKEVGKKIAKAHKLGITFGDCKPENILVTKQGELYFVDLEQASRNGEQAWDIAEFLYYSGHYVYPLSTTSSIKCLVERFIEGYLEGGGKKETVVAASSPKYTKVFSIFTPPQVVLAISKLCARALKM